MLLEVSEKQIDLNQIYRELSDPSCGAVLIFLGTVRNNNDGKEVGALTYEAFAPLAQNVFEQLAKEVKQEISADLKIVIVHRLGRLNLGEISTAIGVSSPHREQSYQASRYLIEQLKLRVPIWKEEHYLEGQSLWLEGNKL